MQTDRKLDDEIYEYAISSFPELSANDYLASVKVGEERVKSEDGKKKWRKLINVSVSVSSRLV